jgi:hypothetical protein
MKFLFFIKRHQFALRIIFFGIIVVCISVNLAINRVNSNRAAGKIPTFYQYLYEPAIRVACGQPFGVDSNNQLSTQMKDFLNLKRESLSCDDVPPSQNINKSPVSIIWYHLLVSVGAVWNVFGITWHSIDIFSSIELAITALIIFLGLSMLMRPELASLIAVLSIVPALDWLTNLRDLNKAPFIIGATVIAVFLARKNLTNRWFLIVMTLSGVWLGYGYGFRPDALIGIPLICITAILFRPKYFLNGISAGFLGSFLLLGAFLLVVSPIFIKLQGGACTWHMAFLGLSDPFTSNLGLHSKGYSFLSHYNDILLQRSVESYAQRSVGIGDIGFCTKLYDQYSRKMFLDVMEIFPYDYLMRSFTSAYKVISFGIYGIKGFGQVPIRNFIAMHGIIFSALVYLIISIFIMATILKNIKHGIFFFFLLAYLCMYPVVQFEERHYFHLAFIALLPFGLLVDVVFNLFISKLMKKKSEINILKNIIYEWFMNKKCIRYLYVFLIISSMIYIILISLFYIQKNKSISYFKSYYSAPILPAEYIFSNKDDSIEFIFKKPEEFNRFQVSGQMLRVDLSTSACGFKFLNITSNYIDESGNAILSTNYLVGLDGVASKSAFMPVYFQTNVVNKFVIRLEKNLNNSSHYSIANVANIFSIDSGEGGGNSNSGCIKGFSWVNSANLPSLWVAAILPWK